MNNLEKHKVLLISLAIVYCFIFGVYYLTSVVSRPETIFLQMRRYFPCALSVALVIAYWRKLNMPWRGLIPYALVSVFWVLVYPVCYWITFHDTLSFIDKHFDQAFGAYLFSFLVSIRLLLLKINKGSNDCLIRCVFALLHTLAMIIPLFQLAYFIIYKYPVTESAAVAFLQTNPAEAKEYILLNFGYLGIICTVLFLTVVYLIFNKLNILYCEVSIKCLQNLSKVNIAVLILIVLATGIYGTSMFRNTGVMKSYMAAKDYFVKINRFKSYHEANYRNLVVAPSKPVFNKPSTVIVVIGESASAYYMSSFSDVKNNNTPWLRSIKENDSFILFPHVYASWGQTVPALERALTEKNQYNKKEFNQSLTIIDIARKAGYDTYWFSNQGYISGADTPITLVAQTADNAKWLSEDKSVSGKYQYDGDLLDYLKQVDSKKNNFVVLHFMGSHEDCINRYPYDFAKFSKPGEFDMVKNYDDSLAYTDFVLQRIYDYSSKNLNLQAMLYFSDHGGDPYRKRHPDVSGFKFLQIPMFVYVSQEYQNLYGDAVKTYKENRNKFFTNDMMYEVVCDLLRVKSNHFEEDNSVLNSKYKFTRETLTTNLGKTKLIEDKEPRDDN